MDRFTNILKQRLIAAQPVQTTHPSTDSLVAFVERGLTGAQRESVLGHLSVCPDCREAVALATHEAAPESAAQALRPAFHFPAAMRWASLAAGLAVAIGVGVIAYEHEAPPVQHQEVVSTDSWKQVANPAASSTPAANAASKEAALSSSLQSSATRSSQPTQSHSVVAEKREVMPAPSLAKKQTSTNVGVLGTLAGAPSRTENGRYAFKALPSAPEAQPMMADKRDAEINSRAVAPTPASSEVVAVTAENKAVQDLDNYDAFAKSSTASGGLIAGNAGTNFAQNSPVPAKSVNTVSLGGSGARGKLATGVFGFVHWTISAAGKLQRRAIDGTLTVVEPVPGAIIRAVAAEGIEVWAGGLRSTPTPKNVQPRSVLFHSSDAGATWNTIDGPWQGSITRVNFAGLGSLTVVATDGTWNTGDGGKSWNRP